MQQNEMFVLGMNEEEYNDAIRNTDYKTLSKHLYRVQSISESDYWMRLHIETINDKTPEAGVIRKYYRIKSMNSLFNLNPHKVKITILGEILES